MATTVKHCTCVSKFQDREYGQGLRVMNVTKELKWRCTVCGQVHGMGVDPNRLKQEGSR